MQEAEREPLTDRNRLRFSVLVHAGFAIVGVVNTFLGALLPTLSLQWRLNDAQAGRLFAAQFSGAMIAHPSTLRIAAPRSTARYRPRCRPG